MRKEDLKNWTRNMLKDEILYQEALIEQRNKDIEIISKRAKELNDENTVLKQYIKDMEDVCDGSCFSDGEDERDKLIAELQDQHQQDCIKINQLHVTIDTLVDKYSRLRNTVGGGGLICRQKNFKNWKYHSL